MMKRRAHSIQIVKQQRASLALRATSDGLVALVPRELDPDDPRIQVFIRDGLQKLPRARPLPPGQWMSEDDAAELVAVWWAKLGVHVEQVRVRAMRRKWASVSSRGTLTLARDLLRMPRELLDYVVCHELLHLRVPSHGKGFRAMLSAHIPDWEQREMQLAAWALRTEGSGPQEA